jgi:NTP pyrophosphatase (non-canonical NTP hydrolase)
MHRLKRKIFCFTYIDNAFEKLGEKIKYRLKEKGKRTFASNHEILGIITEEYYELIEAVKNNDDNKIHDELLDIAVGCILGMACYYNYLYNEKLDKDIEDEQGKD